MRMSVMATRKSGERRAIRKVIKTIACCATISIVLSGLAFADGVDDSIRTVLKVEKEGVGHASAVPALKQLSKESSAALIPILQGMDRANPVTENWLRGAFEAIADCSLRDGTSLPKVELEQFARDRAHGPQSRKLAFDWLLKIDPTASERLVPEMLDDPSSDFRRQAVQRLLDKAKAGEPNDAATKELYQQAFGAALDPDQLEQATKVLSKLGEKPNLKRQLGLLDDWWLIGPFDNSKRVGFDAVYPPEKEVDLQKKYAGKGEEVAWVKKESGNGHAVFDLNKLVATHKGAVMYAYREFNCERDQSLEMRLGTPNGWKMWINGQLVFAHEEYHLTMRMDQYRVPVRLKAGINNILLKICQDEQSVEWAQRWQFQLRVCDSSGKAVQLAGSSSTVSEKEVQ